jgi:hypothetical protein
MDRHPNLVTSLIFGLPSSRDAQLHRGNWPATAQLDVHRRRMQLVGLAGRRNEHTLAWFQRSVRRAIHEARHDEEAGCGVVRDDFGPEPVGPGRIARAERDFLIAREVLEERLELCLRYHRKDVRQPSRGRWQSGQPVAAGRRAWG